MSDIRFEGWLHRSGTGGVYQDSAGNVGIASTQPKTRLDIGNGGFQVGPTGIATVTTVNTTNLINSTQLSHRNIIINGAMQVAQRATTSTSSGYTVLDRFPVFLNGADENPTIAQADVASGTTPYTLGFRKCLKITNGNQTGGVGSNDYVWIQNKIEAQDIANSGWNYTSTSDFITLSFWVKSSVSQTFKGYIETMDGTAQQYPFETGSLSADTWTKITKNIPGNSNLTFDNNINEGFKVSVIPMMGTDKTANSVTEDAWSAFTSSARIKDVTTTWYTTNDATFELTGMQLEVGSEATPFEHRQFGDELARCQRYYYVHADGDNKVIGQATVYQANDIFLMVYPKVTMRTTPTVVQATGTNYYRLYHNGGQDSFNSWANTWNIQENMFSLNANASQGVSVSGGGDSVMIITSQSGAKIAFSAEL